jgi:hypothetical protein
MGSSEAWYKLNRCFGRAMYAVSVLVLALLFFGHRVNMLFPGLDRAFHTLDNHLALLAFFVGAGIAIFAPARSGGGGR